MSTTPIKILGGSFLPSLLSSVVGLLAIGSPTTVLWGVGAVIVDAIEGVARWAFRLGTHVCKEVIESMPSLTKRDASPDIIGGSFVIEVQRPLLHGVPASVFRGDSADERVSVGDLSLVGLSKALFLETAARLGPTARKPLGGYLDRVSARTQAFPRSPVLRVASGGQGGKAVELLVSKVKGRCHGETLALMGPKYNMLRGI